MKKAILFFAILAFAACKKESPPKEPTIELIDASPTSILEFQDSIVIRFSYKDNNGDIGDESPDDYSLEVKDARLPNPDLYHVQPLAPTGTELKIEGELKVLINTMFVLGNGNSETTTLTLKLKDREGNWSNEIITPVITVHK